MMHGGFSGGRVARSRNWRVVTAMDEDRCYECTGYGDDYYTDENGEMKHACDECPFSEWRGDGNG